MLMIQEYDNVVNKLCSVGAYGTNRLQCPKIFTKRGMF